MKTSVLNYRVIVKKEQYPNGDSVYTAFCPALGITDYGDTIEKTLESLKDGIQLAIESLVEEGQTVPIDQLDRKFVTTLQVPITSRISAHLAV